MKFLPSTLACVSVGVFIVLFRQRVIGILWVQPSCHKTHSLSRLSGPQALTQCSLSLGCAVSCLIDVSIGVGHPTASCSLYFLPIVAFYNGLHLLLLQKKKKKKSSLMPSESCTYPRA